MDWHKKIRHHWNIKGELIWVLMLVTYLTKNNVFKHTRKYHVVNFACFTVFSM